MGACRESGWEEKGIEHGRDPRTHSQRQQGLTGGVRFGNAPSQQLGVHPCAPTLSSEAHGPSRCSGLTSWVTRPPIWMGGGVVTEELFTCQARGLALNTRLVSLRLAEENGYLLTRLVHRDPTPSPGKSYFVKRERTQESWL